MSLCDISNVQISNERRVQLLDKNEPLLQENDQRFVLFPIKYQDIWDSYKANLENFWICDDIKVIDTLKRIGEVELKLFRKILSFWATYSENPILFQLNNDIQVPEARCFLGYQIYNNVNHMELYSTLLKGLSAEKLANNKSQLVKNLFAHESFGSRIVAYTAIQSVFTSSIQLMKKLLEKSSDTGNIIKYIDLILRDKADYVRFGPVLMKHCVNKPSNEKIQSIVRSVVEVETEFLISMLEQPMCGIDVDSITDLVWTMGDKVCDLFKCQSLKRV